MKSEQEVRRVGGRYRLVRPLGRGGMGVVWAAVDERLGREVAVKEVIPPTGLTAEQADATRSRSMREARAAARINSDSAVKVYDVVEEDGRPWIVMERLDARPLSEIIVAGEPLEPRRVADIASHLLDALMAAHAKGVLHRDVKPSNVMVVRDGRVVLTDFGIAALDGDPSITTTGVLIGSPAYIAPERAQGEPASAASDLWSLGCTMFAALEGRPPFDRGTSMGTLTAVITEDPLPAPSAGPLSGVLEGLLRKDPAQRLSAEDTQRMLQSLFVAPAAPEPPPSRPATAAEPPSPLGGRTSVLSVLSPSSSAPPVGEPSFPPPAMHPPPPMPPAGPTGGRRSGPWRAVVAAAAALVLIAAVGIVLLVTGEDNPGQEAQQPAVTEEQAGATPSAEPTTDPATDSATDTAETDPVATEVEPTDEANDAVPEGFTRYEDPTGFSLLLPDGWEINREDPRVDFVEPGTGRYLRVDQTDTPQADPVADWENQAASAPGRLSGYEEIRIEPVAYRDYGAADWEFTWTPAEGPPLHVLNRNLITAPDQAYALYWSVPEGQWEDSLPLFQTFADSFQPDA